MRAKKGDETSDKMQASTGDDDDYEEVVFNNIYSRHAFIRKVCVILAIQLAITLGMVLLFMYQEDCKEWFWKETWIVYVAIAVIIVCNMILMCFQKAARCVPMNYILLFICTIFQSIIAGYVSILVRPFMVLVALGITFAVCLTLTVFAIQTSCDFTVCGGLLLVLTVVLLIVSILVMIFPTHTILLVLCGFGTLLFSFYLVFDIQLMIGGNHAHQYSEKDYIVAALCIYIDVVNIFLFLLILCGLLDT